MITAPLVQAGLKLIKLIIFSRFRPLFSLFVRFVNNSHSDYKGREKGIVNSRTLLDDLAGIGPVTVRTGKCRTCSTLRPGRPNGEERGEIVQN